MKLLYAEEFDYYKALGLQAKPSANHTFDGWRHYKSRSVAEHFDALVYSFDNVLPLQLLALQFAHARKPVIKVQDGIYDFANSYLNRRSKRGTSFPLLEASLYTTVAVVSARDASIIASAMPYRCKRLLYPERMGMNNNMPVTPVVLITTGNTPTFSDAERSLLIPMLRAIAEDLRNRPNVSVRFRIFDRDLVKALNAMRANDTTSSMEEALRECTHIVSTPSSVLVSAMQAGINSMQLLYRTTPHTLQASWNLFPGAAIHEELDSFLRGCPERNAAAYAISQPQPVTEALDSVIERAVTRVGFQGIQATESMIIDALESFSFRQANINLFFMARRVAKFLRRIAK